MQSAGPNPYDLLNTAILLVDSVGRIQTANLSAESLLGASSAMLAGQPLDQWLLAPILIARLERDYRRGDLGIRRQQLLWRQALRGEVVLDTTTTLLEEPGLMASFELRELDVAQKIDREEREEALLRMNQSLLRNLGHEVKNPLGGIRGAAQLLALELNSAELREYTDVIIKESDRLQSLVDQMLAPVRQRVVFSEVNIHEVLERVRRLMLSEYSDGLLMQRDYDTSLPEIQGDPEQLIQVVLNITRNAAQALEGRGTIQMRTRAARQVTLHRRRYRLALELSIIDNGPGIPEEIRGQIFYPLVSGNPKGHGLGLTIAQSIVNQHGGVIDCQSDTRGTTFTLLLPIGQPLPGPAVNHR